MIETLPEIVKALREISEWPWLSNESHCVSHPGPDGSRLTSHGAKEVAVCRRSADSSFISSSPRWLAQMVVGWVEERAKRIHYSSDEITRFDDCTEKENDIKDACNEFGISRADWTWLKEKVGE